MSAKTKKKKISRNGLAKWTVINSLDPKLTEELAENNFYLAAWEAYWLWKNNSQKMEFKTLEWETSKLVWDELGKWAETQANPLEDNENILLGLDSTYKLLEDWERFYKRWSSEKFFDQSKVFTIGQPSFGSADKCGAYKFLNQVIVSREQTDEVLIVKGHKIVPQGDLRGAFLIGANLGGANLIEANLTDANLIGANLGGANLTGANLGEAKLKEANLRDANLGGANLTRANLGGANLTDAYLRGANLTDAYLRGANLRGANLTDAYLGGANLIGANLGGAYLGGANLEGANLTDAKLMVANLGGANLMVANLTDAKLMAANLGGANLMAANLEGVNLRKAVFYDEEILLAQNWNTAFFDRDVMERLKKLTKAE